MNLGSCLTRGKLLVRDKQDVNSAVLHQIEENRIVHLLDALQHLSKLFSHEDVVIAAVREVEPVQTALKHSVQQSIIEVLIVNQELLEGFGRGRKHSPVRASSLLSALILLARAVEQDVRLLSAIIVPHCHYDVREAICTDISNVHTAWHML